MSRLTSLLGVTAVSALLSATAVAGEPEQPQAAVSMMQSLDSSIRDAQIKRTQRDYAGAVRTLSQLMLVAPDDARVVGEYGKVLVQQGRSREAVEFLTRAVQLQPSDWTLYSALGIAYDQTGDYANARTAYDRALSLRPGEAVVLNNYAMSRMLAGDPAQARRLIEQAAAGSKDERIARNVKLIDSLPASVATAAAPKPAPFTTPARTAPANLAQRPASASSAQVMMQAVPADPLAGRTAKPKGAATAKPASTPAGTATAKAVKPPVTNGIPALRLANDRQ